MTANAATHRAATMYCKGRHPNLGSNEFMTCYTKQTGPTANRSFTNSGASRKNRRNRKGTRRNRKNTRRNRRN